METPTSHIKKTGRRKRLTPQTIRDNEKLNLRIKRNQERIQLLDNHLSNADGRKMKMSELLSIATFMSQISKTKIDRIAKRNRNGLLCWINENFDSLFDYISSNTTLNRYNSVLKSIADILMMNKEDMKKEDELISKYNKGKNRNQVYDKDEDTNAENNYAVEVGCFNQKYNNYNFGQIDFNRRQRLNNREWIEDNEIIKKDSNGNQKITFDFDFLEKNLFAPNSIQLAPLIPRGCQQNVNVNSIVQLNNS